MVTPTAMKKKNFLFSMCVTLDLNMDTNQMLGLNAYKVED